MRKSFEDKVYELKVLFDFGETNAVALASVLGMVPMFPMIDKRKTGINLRMTISGQQYPRELVKSRFLKLNMAHVEYVMECLRKNTTKIYNIKAYLLAALFNAGATMSNYYRAEVNHDMPQFAG